MLGSDLFGYSDAYIIVKGKTTIEDNNVNNQENEKITFINNAPFRSCLSEIDNTLIDNAEDLDIVTTMHNFLEYSNNYSMTSGRLWNYDRDQVNGNANENNTDNHKINNKKTITSKSFECKIN